MKTSTKTQAMFALIEQWEASGMTLKEFCAEHSINIHTFGKWIAGELKHILPKSQIKKTMIYSYKRWDNPSAYLNDGQLEIDNNLIVHQIRPVALGRKNCLFAGSHKAAHGSMQNSPGESADLAELCLREHHGHKIQRRA